MKKVVNINAIHPISGVSQIVRGRLTNVLMSTEDIFKCLCAKATVTEVIGNTLIPLNFDNYNKNNKPTTDPVVIPTTPVINQTKMDQTLTNYDKKNTDSIVDNSGIDNLNVVTMNLSDTVVQNDDIIVETNNTETETVIDDANPTEDNTSKTDDVAESDVNDSTTTTDNVEDLSVEADASEAEDIDEAVAENSSVVTNSNNNHSNRRRRR